MRFGRQRMLRDCYPFCERIRENVIVLDNKCKDGKLHVCDGCSFFKTEKNCN